MIEWIWSDKKRRETVIALIAIGIFAYVFVNHINPMLAAHDEANRQYRAQLQDDVYKWTHETYGEVTTVDGCVSGNGKDWCKVSAKAGEPMFIVYREGPGGKIYRGFSDD